MPQWYGNDQRKGRWRNGTWQKVQKKSQPNRQPPSKTWGTLASANTSGHASYAAAAASASAKQQQWSVPEWNAWRAGGWKQGPQGTQPGDDSDATGAGTPARDEQRDATTAEIRQELQEVQALRALHARSKNPSPTTTKHLDDRAAALRQKLDNNKSPNDLYLLDKKKLAQLKEKAAKLLEQSTQSWAEISEQVDAAKERDQRYLATTAQIEELEASIPARAVAAGVEPPKPELVTAVDALQRQVERTVAADATETGPLADVMRAANETMRQLQTQLATANNLRLEAQRSQQMDVDRTGQEAADNTGAHVSNYATEPTSTSTATTTTTFDTGTGPQQAASSAAVEPPTSAVSSPVVAPTPGTATTIPSDEDRSAIVQRAQETAAINEGDHQAVAKARSALRARLTQQPDDIDWLRSGTQLVTDAIAKHQPKATQATPVASRPRSRSRSGGSAADKVDGL